MFEKNDAQQALLELLGERKIFHSEDDFKHALAILIHKKYHECKIRLERPFRFNEGSRYEVDLIIENKNILTAFELKYKTRELKYSDGNEKYELTEQNARDWGRYDYLRDINRIQDLINKKFISGGFALLLTNDENYWKPRKGDYYDSQFSLNDQRELIGGKCFKWDAKTGIGTKKNREKPIKLSTNYTLQWKEYSNLKGEKNGLFKYLLVEVGQRGN